jgi:hypothetical protein
VDERVAKAVEIAEPGSWEAELAAQLVAAPSPMERADSASEAVGDLAGLYASRSRWAPAALRIQVAVGLLSAALLFARGSRLEAAVAMAIAVIGGLVSHLVGEAGTREGPAVSRRRDRAPPGPRPGGGASTQAAGVVRASGHGEG